jgi:type II secretory pathway pseudopilin PulG
MLFVLAIMGMTTAIMIPRIQATLRSNADQREAFHFQRLILDLRATAYHREQDLTVVETGQLRGADPAADPLPAEIALDDGWAYRLSGPLTVSARGLCQPATASLSFRGRPRIDMTGDANCAFVMRRTG